MAHRQTATQHQLSVIKPRARLGLGVIAGLYLLLAGRLVYLQAARHSYFQGQAEAYRVSKHVLPALRGQILDRNGGLLAMDDTTAWAVYADPLEVKDPAGTAQALAPLLGLDVARVQTLLTPRSSKNHYSLLKRHVPQAVGNTVQGLNLQGIGVVADTRRIYPNEALAAQVLGFTDSDGQGIEGLEHSQDALLRGRDGCPGRRGGPQGPLHRRHRAARPRPGERPRPCPDD